MTKTNEASRRIATLLSTLTGSGEQSASMARWYTSRRRFVGGHTEARRRRLALLATEGVFYMRHPADFEMSDARWHEIFADLYDYAASSDQVQDRSIKARR